MTSNIFLILHILAGAIALVAGFLAIIYKKGSFKHRQFGKVFTYAMVFMGGGGAYLAYFKPEIISTLNGMLTVYLVVTGLVTVQRKVYKKNVFDKFALLTVLIICILDFYVGYLATQSESGTYHKFPAAIYFFFGSIAAIAVIFDVKMIWNGGFVGGQRMTRHVWRMCFALLIATASFFLGQMQVLPEFMQQIQLLVIPVFAVLFVMLFWLYQTLFTRRFKSSKPISRRK